MYAGTIPSLAANVAENSILFAAYGVCQKLVARASSIEDVSKLPTFANGCAGKYSSAGVLTTNIKLNENNIY